MSIISFISIDFNILLSWHPPAVQACDEQFYAIYYTTEFKFIGRGDAFIAPTNGTYTFKLWGSPGGGGSNYASGYTEVNLHMKRGDKIYCFVGSGGTIQPGSFSPGGYNGGGPCTMCPYGVQTHIWCGCGSGGGAAHISEVYNPINSDTISYSSYGSAMTLPNNGGGTLYLHRTGSWSQLDKVIAVAGGAGGTSSKAIGYAGGTVAYGAYWAREGYLPHSTNYRPANNITGAGYARGYGMYCAGSSAGGGGWYSGYSRTSFNSAVCCSGRGGGGTSYIRLGIEGFMLSGNDPLNNPGQPYEKPQTEGINGYIKVMKQ